MLARRAVWFFLFACSVVASACGSETPPPISPVYDKNTGTLRLLELDTNDNGRIDARSHMNGTRVLHIEIDSDEDGKNDRWEYYDPEGRLDRVGLSRLNDGREDAWLTLADDGETARMDIATRQDGKVTRTEYYENDSIVRAEEDSDADGRPDRWETYESGRITVIAFDTLHNGSPDRRLVYGSDGAARLEIVNASGQFVRGDVPAERAAATR
jgi:hypothetical protein